MLEKLDGKIGEHHAGELRREHGENRAERIIAEELQRLGWTEADLETERKNAPGKLYLAARLRRETTMTVKWIAARVNLGTSKSANGRLHAWMKNQNLAMLPKTAPSRDKQSQPNKQNAKKRTKVWFDPSLFDTFL